MQKYAIYGRLQPKAGKENDVEAFLKAGLAMAQQEPFTRRWFALKEDGGAYSIFDTFDTEEDRSRHLHGEIAKALMAKADELFSEPPQLHMIEILGEK